MPVSRGTLDLFVTLSEGSLKLPRARAAARVSSEEHSAGDGSAELEDRARAKRHLRRIAGLTRPIVGVPRRAHALEPAPRGTLSI